MRKIKAIALLALAIPFHALAEDVKVPVDQPKPAAEAPSSGAHVFIYGGANVGAATASTVKSATGTQLGQTSSSGKNAPLFGVEGKKDIAGYPLSISGIFERSPYNYVDGSPADGEYSFLVMPSARYDMGAARLWAGAGVGMVITTIGEPTNGTLSLPSSATGFNYTLRTGADYTIASRYLIGAAVAYTGGTATMDVTQASVVAGKIDFERHWVTLGVRFGVSF